MGSAMATKPASWPSSADEDDGRRLRRAALPPPHASGDTSMPCSARNLGCPHTTSDAVDLADHALAHRRVEVGHLPTAKACAPARPRRWPSPADARWHARRSRASAGRRPAGTPGAGSTWTTLGRPSVSVPVLSTTSVSTFSMRSRASASRISTPCCAPRPTPTMMDIGVASPSAQGQAMMSTATAAISA